MAQGMYLVNAPGQELEQLATAIRARVGAGSGDPLVAVGANRAVVPAGVATLLAQAAPGVAVTETLLAHGARRAEPLSLERAAELMRSRDASEFALVRGAGGAPLVNHGVDWHLARTKLAAAWDLAGGRDAIDWGTIVVGQVDTGWTEHPALGFGSATPFVDTDRDWNYFTAETDPEPGTWADPPPRDSAHDPLTGPNGGHGTRTATVLAGHDPAAGYYGAAPRVPYIPVRLSNCIEIGREIAGLADALAHLIDVGGVDVITMSMGTSPGGLPPKARAELARAYEHGIIVCCAAGNYAPFVVVPARERHTIAVAGCAPGDRPWSGSSCGPQVDISAPAWPIRRGTAEPAGAGVVYSYGYGDGTSFATPQVAGTAALWLAHRGGEIRRKYGGWQRVEAFKKLLLATADDCGGAWDKANYGAGILDAAAVLQADLPPAASLRREA